MDSVLETGNDVETLRHNTEPGNRDRQTEERTGEHLPTA